MTDQEHPEFEPVASLPYDEAVLLAGRLRADGIDAHVYPPDPPAMYGEVLGRMHDVLVRTTQLQMARETLEHPGG